MAQLITANNIDPSTLSVISGPRVSGIQYPGDDTAASTLGGQTIVLTGAGFQPGAVVYVNSVAVGVTTVVSGTMISFVAPANESGNYPLYVVNTDGSTATLAGIQYSGTPTWNTPAGSLGTLYETQPFGYSLSATSDSAVAYTVTSGTIAAGAALNASTGNITGNANLVESSTTYSFTVDAVDQEQQNTSRNFSIIVNPDIVTFNSPNNNSVYTAVTGDPLILSLNASSVLQKTISYQANVLPAGLTISGNLISGNFTTASQVTTLITGTSADTNKSSSIVISWSITSASFGIDYLVVAGGGAGGSNVDYSNGGGGGGAGGMLQATGYTVDPGTTYTITIGAGGVSNLNSGGTSGGGTNSSFATITATGGGGGGNRAGGAGGSGGSGGGRAPNSSSAGGTGIAGQGNNGGAGSGGGYGGGGGGAGQAGNAGGIGSPGSNGGNGLQSSITGTATYYAGGGGGAGKTSAGGLGGGGAGGTGAGTGGTNTGGGGGGRGGSGEPRLGATGGSGVVILSSPNAASATTGAPTATFVNSRYIYRFTSSGSITF
jgi:hypothetical protein